MRIFPGGDVLSLNNAINGVVPEELRDRADGSIARNWAALDDDTLVGQWTGGPVAKLVTWDRRTGVETDVWPQPETYDPTLPPRQRGYDRIEARGGVWALAGHVGVEDSRGRQWPNAYIHDISDEGDLYLTQDRGGGMQLEVYHPLGQADSPYLTQAGAWKAYDAGGGALLWMDVTRRWHALGAPELPAGLFGLPVQLPDGRRFCVDGSAGVGLFAWDGDVPLGAVWAGFYFNQAAQALGGNLIGVAASAGAGEQPGEERVFQIDVGSAGTPASAWTATLNGQPIAPTWTGDVRHPPDPGYDLDAICAAIRAATLPATVHQSLWLDTNAPLDQGGHGACVDNIRAINSPMRCCEIHQGARYTDEIVRKPTIAGALDQSATVPDGQLRGIFGSAEGFSRFSPADLPALMAGIRRGMREAQGRGVPFVQVCDGDWPVWFIAGLKTLEAEEAVEVIAAMELYPTDGMGQDDDALDQWEAEHIATRDRLLGAFRRIGTVRSVYTQSAHYPLGLIIRLAPRAHRIVRAIEAGRLYSDDCFCGCRPSGTESHPELKQIMEAVAASNPAGDLPALRPFSVTPLPPTSPEDDMGQPQAGPDYPTWQNTELQQLRAAFKAKYKAEPNYEQAGLWGYRRYGPEQWPLAKMIAEI